MSTHGRTRAKSHAVGKCYRESSSARALSGTCDPVAWAFNYDYRDCLDVVTLDWSPDRFHLSATNGYVAPKFSLLWSRAR